MATKGRKGGAATAEEQLDQVRALADAEMTPENRERVRAALRSPRALVAAAAAAIVKDRALDGFGKDLVAAFERFLVDAVKRDPGCRAKLAAIEALDFIDHPDSEPFRAAARWIQLEPAWGKPVDTAAALRCRGVVAFARVGHPDLVLLAGELMADKESPVRQAVADALALHGNRAGAGLLLYKLRLGDEDPLVPTACLTALLALAPDRGLAEARTMLQGDDLTRDVAALALGQSARDDALTLLLEHMTTTPAPKQRAAVLRAVGLHRSERALEHLLGLVADGALPDAKGALEALAPRRFDLGVRDRARRAAHARKLDELFARVFPSDEA